MTRFLRLAALAALAFPLAASAQSADRQGRGLERMVERLDLTDAQVAILRGAMTSERDPAASWAVAARLAPTMTDAQLDRLKERPERGARRGERDGNGRAERSADERREDRQQRRAESDAAREAALGLTDSQKQALADLRDDRQSERGSRASEMAEILTDEQEAILLVHRAITPRGGRGVKERRGGRPQ